MYSEISFPGLGITLNPPTSFSVGPLSIHFYGLIIATGLMLAVLYCSKRSHQFGLDEDTLLDGVLCVTPVAVIFARIYYCLFSWELYADDPIRVLYIWEGGIAIYGSVIGAILGIIVFCKVKKIRITTVLDLVSLGFLIGQFIGRWGNFFNREAFGAETASFLRMGLMKASTGVVTYYHPTFLYESLWNFTGFLVLHFLSRKRRYDGQIALGYLAWYGLGRAFIEGLRTDSLYIGPFRVSQLLAAGSCVVALAILIINGRKLHNPENLFVNQVAAKKAEE